MIGFVIGTLALVGLVSMVRRGRWNRRFGGGRPGGRSGSPALRALFTRIEATPDQEKVIFEALEEAQTSLRDVRGELNDTRRDLAKAVAADHFDPLLLDGTFTRHDERVVQLRLAITGALAKVHGVLDPTQRERFAELVRHGLGSGTADVRGALAVPTNAIFV